MLVICCILLNFSYKFAPTFFFQRENRTIYSIKQLFATLLQLTFSIVIVCIPCLFSSLPYLSKSAMIFTISSLISLIYSTFFLQSLFCYIGPTGHKCSLIPGRLKFTRRSKLQITTNNDLLLRKSTSNIRRHQRVSISSYLASSYFSQVFTSSTYFDSEFSGIHDSLIIGSRRRESSRSHQLTNIIKRNSLLAGEAVELYTPRTSLAPCGHQHRYSRHSSVSRGLSIAGPMRPLYVLPSVLPSSQLNTNAPASARQGSPSSNACRSSHSPSPHSSTQLSVPIKTDSLRPCQSSPRLHSVQLSNTKKTNTFIEETSSLPSQHKKNVTIIKRQDAVSSTDDFEPISNPSNAQLTSAKKRDILKAAAIESGHLLWIKRSNSS